MLALCTMYGAQGDFFIEGHPPAAVVDGQSEQTWICELPMAMNMGMVEFPG